MYPGRAVLLGSMKFLEALAQTATRFTIGEGERKTLDLQLQDVRGPGGDRDGHGDFDDDSRDRGPSVIEDDAPQVRDPGAAPQVGSGSITGRVVIDDATNQPLRKVRVSARAIDARVERTAYTDDNGRFTIGTLPPSLPVFLAQGLEDTTVDPPVTIAYMHRLCAAGSTSEDLGAGASSIAIPRAGASAFSSSSRVSELASPGL